MASIQQRVPDILITGGSVNSWKEDEDPGAQKNSISNLIEASNETQPSPVPDATMKNFINDF